MSTAIESQFRSRRRGEDWYADALRGAASESVPQTQANRSTSFDRLLVAQTCVESMAILTADPIFQLYPVLVKW